MHQSSFLKMQTFRQKHLTGREREPLRILDVGSQDVNGCYKPIFDSPHWRYVGLDMNPGPNVDIVLDNPYDWSKLRANEYDVVISGQALEHIEFFWITMLEISRILKYGGICCLIAPSGGYEHRYPVDCWRYYPDGFYALARWARLEVLEVWTEWEPPEYGDGSELWKDTTMVCAKPNLPMLASFRRRTTELLLLTALRDAVKRHRGSRPVGREQG